jgi:hypothetical protein
MVFFDLLDENPDLGEKIIQGPWNLRMFGGDLTRSSIQLYSGYYCF